MPYTSVVDTTLAYQPDHDPIRMYALVEDSLVVVVQRAVFDPILQPAENPASLRIHGPPILWDNPPFLLKSASRCAGVPG
jgi:hypothetical protein